MLCVFKGYGYFRANLTVKIKIVHHEKMFFQ